MQSPDGLLRFREVIDSAKHDLFSGPLASLAVVVSVAMHLGGRPIDLGILKKHGVR